ncbi:hypothetical protein EVAR_46644_1 [Eumeta japonica]|uniref:Uncharacterized protein n=1 Tax=Eumeta variegata TaxID=151549 RepID=A0A4C1WHM4_EUMVA|nr:hypothetical protein EVAR_46644_1 [Eumeta japonica]
MYAKLQRNRRPRIEGNPNDVVQSSHLESIKSEFAAHDVDLHNLIRCPARGHFHILLKAKEKSLTRTHIFIGRLTHGTYKPIAPSIGENVKLAVSAVIIALVTTIVAGPNSHRHDNSPHRAIEDLFQIQACGYFQTPEPEIKKIVGAYASAGGR